MSITKTKPAFDVFRAAYEIKAIPPERVTNQDQIRQMTAEDGLRLWQDGPVEDNTQPTGDPPVLTVEDDAEKMLWTVREGDVPYAAETCPFGKALESRAIKHSNLTGGGPAFCAGELLIWDEQTIIINGSSGRYGPRSAEELEAIAKAFKAPPSSASSAHG